MTNGKNFNNTAAQPVVLVAPLEWGLGHATRCIPIINQLLNQNCKVLIAAEGATWSLLKEEFPSLEFLPLMGYRMKYSRRRSWLPVKIILQLPRIIYTIWKEHRWLADIVRKHKIDAVISDNRFGLYNHKARTVYITHQLLIKTGNRFTERMAKKIHHFFIKKYNECWVPDFQKLDNGINGLAGELSHQPSEVKYLGALSRFEIMPSEKKYDLLIIISGPEPQRTLFEKKILGGLKEIKGRIMLVRGLPGETGNDIPLEIEVRNHLPAKALNEAIMQSGMVLSRSGYTTVMDLARLRKKAILVPTPGQTEQEYLAEYLISNKIFYTVPQDKFELKNCLEKANTFPFHFPAMDMDQYKKVVDEFVSSL